MHIILLVLIVIVLILIILLRPEEERLLSRTECQDTLPGRYDQPQNTRDPGTFDHLSPQDGRLKLTDDDRKTEEIEIARKNIAKLQRDLSASVSQNAELQRQIEGLSRDLEGARRFLTTADTSASSEVIQLVGKLNAELQHTSTIMADRVVGTFKLDRGAMMLGPDQQIVMKRASESIGSTLVQSFQTARPDDFPMYLQIAFQAYLTYHVCWIVSSWTLDQGHNAFINEIYQRLRETEMQTISARWRSLMRTYTLPTCVSEPSSFVTPILAGLFDILLAAGCATSRSDITSELSSMFETKLLSAVLLAGRLNQVISGVISGDFEVFVVRPGVPFHEGTMEEDMDDNGDEVQGAPGRTERAKIVLCTSELGLTKRVQLGSGKEKEVVTVVRAKVILESFLDAED